MFADSGLTAGLQIADIVSGMVYTNAYREKIAPAGAVSEHGYLDYTHMLRFQQPLRDIVFVSANVYGTQRMYGLRNIDHRVGPAARNNLVALQRKYARCPLGCVLDRDAAAQPGTRFSRSRSPQLR